MDWPAPMQEAETCPDIAGVYAEVGQASHHSYQSPSLAENLNLPDIGQNQAIEITQPDASSITISGVYASNTSKPQIGDTSFKWALDNDDFHCDDGKIWIRPTERLTFLLNKTGLTKTTDGSLLAEDHYFDDVGVFVKYIMWPVYTPDN